ncbi:unnamed protein product [Spirodela intermedia]|uniref:Uncharacterized protein n=1 Tax=Spirodela intermedia TaxID=51605 RepID=A0A7I8JY93_SPIIN|nr:unnamed protein product [Spirodela intermedia]
MEAYGGGGGGGGGLKGYWRRKQYNQLFSGGGGGNRWRETRRRRVVLGGAAAGDPRGATKPRPRRFWRIRVAPKLQVLRQAISPRRFLARLRDAYVRMMLSFASSGGPFSGGGLAYYGTHNPVAELSRPPLKEYDDKMILEMYKSLVAQKHLVPAAGRPTDDPLRSTILHRPH